MAISIRAWFDKVFKKPDKKNDYNINDILSGVIPIYSNGFGEDIYASDVVQQAIYSIVIELKKLDPVHVRKNGNDYTEVYGSVQNVLEAPNPLMTTSDFIEKVAWTLLLNYNAFIYPIWNGKNLVALYPLQPLRVDFQQEPSGKLWVVFTFPNGYEGQVEYEKIIHLRYKYSLSEFMGGNKQGQPDVKPLLDTLKLNDTLLKGLAKSLNLHTSINGVVKLKNMVNYEGQIAKVKEFEKKLQSNQSGLLPLDISAEYIPISKQANLMDDKVLQFIEKKVCRWFNTSIAILDGDYTPQQHEAFYQKAVEPIVKTFNQAFTKGIFTTHESIGYKNQIKFYEKELVFLNMDQKIKLFDILVDTGSCYKNEMRTAFGMRPINALDGQLAESSNKTNAENNKVDNGDNVGGVTNG